MGVLVGCSCGDSCDDDCCCCSHDCFYRIDVVADVELDDVAIVHHYYLTREWKV